MREVISLQNVFLTQLLNCYFVVRNVSSGHLLAFISISELLLFYPEHSFRIYFPHTHTYTHTDTPLYKIWGPFSEVIQGMCLLYKLLGWCANEHCLHNILCPVSWQISSFWNKSVWFGITIYKLKRKLKDLICIIGCM